MNNLSYMIFKVLSNSNLLYFSIIKYLSYVNQKVIMITLSKTLYFEQMQEFFFATSYA